MSEGPEVLHLYSTSIQDIQSSFILDCVCMLDLYFLVHVYWGTARRRRNKGGGRES